MLSTSIGVCVAATECLILGILRVQGFVELRLLFHINCPIIEKYLCPSAPTMSQPKHEFVLRVIEI